MAGPDILEPIAVVGAGAVGCYYGGMVAKAGHKVTFIGRPAHVDAMNAHGLVIEDASSSKAIEVRATTALDGARGARLVLFCVKSSDTESAGRELVKYIDGETPVLCLQNGVENAARLRAATGLNAQSVVVYIGCYMAGPGRVFRTGRGDLVINAFDRAESIAALFEHAEVPCRISPDVDGELWAKLAINCAYNAISALCRARYERVGRHPLTKELLLASVREVIAVAEAANVKLPDGTDLIATALSLPEIMPQAYSSTAQDLFRGKATEIDALNGFIARRGAELGVAVPVNTALHALVKLLEENPALES